MMPQKIVGHPVICEEDEDDIRCYENRKVEITGESISEVIRKVLKAYYDADLIIIRVGSECIGYYNPMKNTLNVRADFTNVIGDWEFDEVNSWWEPMDC
jgi:hypothetical protein